MSLEVKVIAGALLLLILGCSAYFGIHSVYSTGVKAGAAQTQIAWDADKLRIQALTDAALAQANAQKDMAIQANEVIANDYQTKLSAALADAQSLAQRLSDAEARLAANSRAVSQAASIPSVASTGAATSNDQLTDAVARVFAECTQNADQLDALNAELKSQL